MSSIAVLDQRPDNASGEPNVSPLQALYPFRHWMGFCSLLSFGIGFSGLIGWFANIPFLAQGLPDSVFISVREAFVFLVLGLTLRVYSQKPLAISARLYLVAGSLIALLFSGINNRELPFLQPLIEPLLLRDVNFWEYLYRDRMPPVTMVTFYVLGAALLAMALSHVRYRWVGNTAGCLFVLILFLQSVIALGYTYGFPVVYPHGFKPPSVLSAIAFMAIAIGSIAMLGRRHFPIHSFAGPSIRARLLRTFLPVGLASIVIYSLLMHTVLRSLNPTLTSSLSALIAMFIVVYLVFYTSRITSYQIERAVRESELRFGVLVESLRDFAIFMLDPRGHVMTWNEGAERFQGYREEEVLGEDFGIFYTTADRYAGKHSAALQEALKRGSYKQEGWRIRKDGTPFYAESVLTAIYGESGRLRGFAKVVRDITDRRNSEIILQKKTTYTQMLQKISYTCNEVSTLSDAIAMCLDLICQHADWDMAHGLVVSADGKKMESATWQVRDTERFKTFREFSDTVVFERGHGMPGKVWNSAKPLWIRDLSKEEGLSRYEVAREAGVRSSCAFPIFDARGIVGVLEFFSAHVVPEDEAFIEVMTPIGAQLGRVAEREKAERHISRSLREKELLLKEIHHRVKNNLQIISSLLRLQTKQVSDSAIISALRESQNRIASMAMVHEYLYQSEDMAHIQLSEYIVKLVTGLLRSYGIDRENIDLSFDVEAVSLELDLAVPCGLIITELVSNALKYAFPEGKAKPHTIRIGFHALGDDNYRLEVEDNGIGMPESVSIEQTSSLGLRIVNTLTQQLKGTLSLNRKNGTQVTIVFKDVH